MDNAQQPDFLLDDATRKRAQLKHQIKSQERKLSEQLQSISDFLPSQQKIECISGLVSLYQSLYESHLNQPYIPIFIPSTCQDPSSAHIHYQKMQAYLGQHAFLEQSDIEFMLVGYMGLQAFFSPESVSLASLSQTIEWPSFFEQLKTAQDIDAFRILIQWMNAFDLLKLIQSLRCLDLKSLTMLEAFYSRPKISAFFFQGQSCLGGNALYLSADLIHDAASLRYFELTQKQWTSLWFKSAYLPRPYVFSLETDEVIQVQRIVNQYPPKKCQQMPVDILIHALSTQSPALSLVDFFSQSIQTDPQTLHLTFERLSTDRCLDLHQKLSTLKLPVVPPNLKVLYQSYLEALTSVINTRGLMVQTLTESGGSGYANPKLGALFTALEAKFES